MKQSCILFPIIIITFVLFSCHKEEDIPPALTLDKEANMTIAELLSLYTVNNAYSYVEIPDSTVICGIVTSSDKEQNCYKYLTIQDETSGIMIVMKSTELYERYPVGAKVFVECGDMVIGHKYKNKQIALLDNDAMVGIPKSDENLYLFTDGKAGPEPEPRIITSRNQIDSTYFNCLVRVEGVRMQNGGGDTYCPDTVTTYCSRYMMLEDSTTITLRTYARASFANELLPIGRCNMTGILINSNSGPLLYLRSLEDISYSGQ